MNIKICFLSSTIILGWWLSGQAALQEFVVERFSSETAGIPKGWEELTFKKIPNHTHYSVVQEDDNFYLKAESKNSSSGILKKIESNLIDYPILQWRWKIDHVLQKADAMKKSGDDYSARIYVAFKYDPNQATTWEKVKYGLIRKLYGQYPPKAALNYIWDNRLPVNTALDNAYTDRAKMIVVETGKEKVGQWILEERNIYQDYKKLFGSEPPQISFVAVMTDTDNTGESAVAYFDDIVFKAQ